MNEWLILILIVLGLIAAGFIIWGILRWRYIKSLRDKGWEFDDSPPITIAHGLNNPPFGRGFDRKVDDQVTGTTSQGLPFSVFEYSYDGGGTRVVAIELQHALPPWSSQEAGIATVTPQLSTDSADDPTPIEPPAEGAAAAPEAAEPETAGADYPLALSRRVSAPPGHLLVDGRWLVGLDVPENADRMEAYVNAAGASAQAIRAVDLSSWRQPDPPMRLGFTGTDHTYVPADDSVLERTSHTTSGHSHRAKNVITGEGDLPFIAYMHHWQTTHTRTVSDGKGGTRTETYTVNHSEPIFEIHLPFDFVTMSINTRGDGDDVNFEDAAFNRRFDIHSTDPRLAHAVIHPRHMEWLMANPVPPFRIHSNRVVFSPESHDVAGIEPFREFARSFFGQVPEFVWKDLGIADGANPVLYR